MGQLSFGPDILFYLGGNFMAGSTFGTLFKITTWGESHGAGVGVVVDGCPAGLSLCEDDIQKFLNRRKPGQSRYTTPRKEDDAVEILSGVFEGKTTGTPISMLVRNQNQRSKDYSEIASYYRPGHADLTFDLKYGFRDYRGGGRSSGRETIGRVAAGAIACKILDQLGIKILTYTKSIGDITADPACFDRSVIMENPFYMPDADAAKKAGEFLEECMKNEDSSGGSIECVIQNMPAGIGEPVFEKLSANLGKAILSIGAVKAFEIGDGTAVAMHSVIQTMTSIQGIRMERSSNLPTTPAVSWAASATEVTSFCVYPSNRRLRSQENSPPLQKTEAADRFL